MASRILFGRSRRGLAASQWPCLIAHFAKSQLWHASTLLFGFFLTEICGLGIAAMGFIMAGSLAFNGMIDAALGWRWRRRVGGLRDALRLQAWGAPVTSLFFLLFCITPLIGAGHRLGWALLMLSGFRASYPFLDIPQNALVALADFSAETRCALLAKRNVASGLAGLAVGVVAAPLLMQGRDVTLWFVWAGCLAILACHSARRLERTCGIGADDVPVTRSVPDPLFRLPFGIVLGAVILMVAASATFRTLEPYHAAFAGRGLGLMLWAAIGGLAGQCLWLTARRRATTAAWLVLAALSSGLAAAGLLWTTSSGTALAGIGFGMASGILWLALWSAMIHHAAAGQATGYVGIFTCVSKLAQAAAMLMLGRVMATSSYRDTWGDPQSTPSLLMLWALLMIGATALTLALAYALSRTRFDERRAPPHPSHPTDPDPARRHRASSPARYGRAVRATAVPANRPHR